jgi:hypothetical protein
VNEPTSPGSATERLPWKGHRVGRLILTTCRQGSGSPIIDDAFTHDADGNRYVSKAILLTPWRRKNRHGERPPMRALVIGWRER